MRLGTSTIGVGTDLGNGSQFSLEMTAIPTRVHSIPFGTW